MCVLYHGFNRTADITRRNQMCDHIIILTGLPTLPEEIRYVCCIIVLTGLSTILGEMRC